MKSKINNNTDIYGCFFHNNPEAKAQRSLNRLSLCLVIQRGMRVTPLGYCLRVVVNDKHLNLEKTVSSVLSILLLIYGLKKTN